MLCSADAHHAKEVRARGKARLALLQRLCLVLPHPQIDFRLFLTDKRPFGQQSTPHISAVLCCAKTYLAEEIGTLGKPRLALLWRLCFVLPHSQIGLQAYPD